MPYKLAAGSRALIAGASEGIGAAFAHHLAAAGIHLVLVARRLEQLEQLAAELKEKYPIVVEYLKSDLSDIHATLEIKKCLQDKVIDILVYNAALSFIGPFENNSLEEQRQIAQTNMVSPMNMIKILGEPMLSKGSGAIILMASLAGFQGSGFLAAYAATKAFNRVLAESLWYEWKSRGVDVIACCAGATATPNYINSKPEKTSFFTPRVQSPAEVVSECFEQLGKQPSLITGRGNRWASFIMQKLLPRKMAITIMGDTTRKMYRF
jgi:short-subunit dehydrogenase